MLITYADADAVKIEHIMEFYKLLGGGQKDAGMDGNGRPISQLAILPSMTHYNIINFPNLATILNSFLEVHLTDDR